jgi:hypothetical protein
VSKLREIEHYVTNGSLILNASGYLAITTTFGMMYAVVDNTASNRRFLKKVLARMEKTASLKRERP